MKKSLITPTGLSRRTALKGIGAGASLAAAPGFVRYAQAQTDAPIRLGAPFHRTGIGASYGRWYEQVATAAVDLINAEGGINGRPVELVIEDDGTDPQRATEIVEKFATEHEVDLIFGHLFSHVVVACAPRVGELKIPYVICSEGHQTASGALNRYVLQPGITDVKAQVISMAPWVSQNLGKKVTMFFPDYAFGHDHRDYFSQAIVEQGGEVLEMVPIPPTETSFTRYFPNIASGTEVIYHVMVGPGVLTFVKELGEYLGSDRPEIFGFVDSIEAVDLNAPQLEFLDGTYFWEGHARYAQPDQTEHDLFYRSSIGVDENGASVDDPQDVSTYAHMFSVWETLFAIKQAMELCDYQGTGDRVAFIEAMESIESYPEGREHPQGDKIFNAQMHQCFGHQNISRVEDGRLNVVHRTSIEDGLYEPEGDYTQMSF